MASGDLIPRVYYGFRGVDFRGEEINLVRSPDSINMWKDYKETESIRTRPDKELLSVFDETVYGIYFYKAGSTEMMIVHSGTKLYKVIGEEAGNKNELLYEGVEAAKSNAFIYNNIWFFKDGANYLQYNGVSIGKVEGYVPTTSIARKPSGGGKTYEDVNMLSDYRINTFLADGKSKEFFVDSPTIDDDFMPVVTVNDKETTNFTVDYAKSKITFTTAPAAPLTDGQDNVSIKYKKAIDKSRILKCTMLELFDNRVFFSGNPDYPNMIWHCSLNDPTYCSDLDYYNEGLDTARVMDMVAGNNVLWVFKEPSQANTTVFYHTPTIDSEYGKIYPNTHSSISTGCIGKAINFNDDIVFFSDRGMEGVSGDITTEQVISHRSILVDRKLIAEADYADMILEEWEGYLIVIIGNKAYLADSRAVFTNENHFEYEWFYWEFDKKITCAKVNKGVLYLGTEDGIYTLTDTKSNVESYWVTPKDKFKHPQYVKTTNKRGCVVEATGDISVYAKTEKTDFELIGTYENINDSFVSRIKCKKFKDIQLKFYSKTRFSLETATLECFIGGYVKR
ncbi:MAG: hypothetical protein IJ349_05335 [Clostridia bacterium]|nr:hypothetical protein [Clostridia bacterium]